MLWELFLEKKKKKEKAVLENFSSLEHILRGLCMDLKNTDMISIFGMLLLL